MKNYPNNPINKRMFNLHCKDYDYKAFCDSLILRLDKTPELLRGLSGKIVLDIGCGYGTYLIEALRMVKEPKKVIHLDANFEVFKSQKNLTLEEIELLKNYWKGDPKICADAHNLPFADNSIDIAIMYGTLLDNCEGLKPNFDREVIQEELRRVLKPDGFYFGDDFIVSYEDEELPGFSSTKLLPGVFVYRKLK